MDKKAWIMLGATLVVVIVGTIAANILSAKVPAIGKLQSPTAKA